MMSIDIWLAFVLAATIILIIPGPTIILVVSQAVTHGKRSVVPLVAGVLFGDFTAMILSLIGLGAMLSASAALFHVFKWIGAFYLIYLGVILWRTDANVSPTPVAKQDTSGKSLFKSAYIVTALNPKGIAFFVAFLPQFVDHLKPAFAQLVLLGGTFLFLAVLNATVYALFAGHLREAMKKKSVHRWFNRCGGSALIGAGLFTAGLKQST